MQCRYAARIKLRSVMTRATRDKETYFIQRSAISRVEHESISKFIERTESRFEANWATYEQQLQKYLTSSTKQYKDWMQCKDAEGKVFWTNRNTLQEQYEHPGVKVFQLNKKLLRTKALQELDEQFAGIHARKHAIMEVMLGLKHKLVLEIMKLRLRTIYESKLPKLEAQKAAS